MEYLITHHCLQRYLPNYGLVLDAGSGPGRYALDLARWGYRIVLFDLVREMLDLARSKISAAVDRVGCEGLAAHLPVKHLEEIERDPSRWPGWEEILLETCNDPTILGLSNHLLVVARKPDAPST